MTGTGNPDNPQDKAEPGNTKAGQLSPAPAHAGPNLVDRVTALRGQAIARPPAALKKRRRNEGATGDELKNLTDSPPPRGSDESEDLHQKVEDEKISKEIFEPLGHSRPGAAPGTGHEENRELEWARRHVRDDPAEKHLLEVFRKTELRLRPPVEEARRRYRCRKLQEMRKGRSP